MRPLELACQIKPELRIDVRQRVVPNVSVHIPRLRVFDMLIRKRLVGACPP